MHTIIYPEVIREPRDSFRETPSRRAASTNGGGSLPSRWHVDRSLGSYASQADRLGEPVDRWTRKNGALRGRSIWRAGAREDVEEDGRPANPVGLGVGVRDAGRGGRDADKPHPTKFGARSSRLDVLRSRLPSHPPVARRGNLRRRRRRARMVASRRCNGGRKPRRVVHNIKVRLDPRGNGGEIRGNLMESRRHDIAVPDAAAKHPSCGLMSCDLNASAQSRRRRSKRGWLSSAPRPRCKGFVGFSSPGLIGRGNHWSRCVTCRRKSVRPP